MNLYQLRACLLAQLGIKVRQRLIEQEIGRLLHQRTAQSHTLLLAAAQLMRLFIFVALQMQQLQRLTRALFDFCLRQLLQLQAKGYILPYAQMRKQRIALKHHGNIAFTRRNVVDSCSAHEQIALCDFLKARNHAQRRRLAAAGRPQQNQALALFYLQIQIVDDDIFSISLLHL